MAASANRYAHVLIGALFLLAAALAPRVHAASIVVTGAADTPSAGDGVCTLREAITNANNDTDSTSGDCAAGSGADTITFAVNFAITLADSQLPAPLAESRLSVGCPWLPSARWPRGFAIQWHSGWS